MKVFCVGDSSINVFLQIPKNADSVSLENEKRLMQFRLGSKIQLENEVVTVGGNALNVAVGLARQGIDVDFFSIIGGDSDGQRIIDFFDSEIQNLKLKIQKENLKFKIEKLKGVKTNVGYVINFQSERFLLIDTSEKNYKLLIANDELTNTDWVFLSSVGPNYEEFFKELLELKTKVGFKLAYNPSSNELKNSVETYIGMVETSDVLFVNKKEMLKIVSNSALQVSKVEEFIQKLWEVTRKLVVATDGIRGSYAFDGNKIYFEPSSGEVAIEKTGAGDAYESGFLAEFLKTGNIQAAMKNGTENAASVIKYVGAVEGLIYK